MGGKIIQYRADKMKWTWEKAEAKIRGGGSRDEEVEEEMKRKCKGIMKRGDERTRNNEVKTLR